MKPIFNAVFQFFTIFSSLFIAAQNLQISPLNHSFVNTSELQTDSLSLSLANTGNRTVSIRRIYLPNEWQSRPFSAKDSLATILPNATWQTKIYFKPKHNTLFKGPIVAITDSFYGGLIVDVQGQGVFSNTYYNSTQNLSGTPLFNALKARISSPYTSLGYNTARDNMYGNIDNLNGAVTCVYTGRTANFSTRAGATSNGFNTEHTWPQSLFGSNEPMQSDLHHLYPTDETANSQRGNLPFGVVTGSILWQNGGSKKGSSSFEPRDAHKGGVARTMMYFVMRYQNYSNFFTSQESTLRQWHQQFPPTSAQKLRNQDIASLQQNRNPFVDYPQFIDRLGPLTANGALPNNPAWKLLPDTIIMCPGIQAQAVVHNTGNTSLSLTQVSSNLPQVQVQWNGNTTLAPGEFRAISLNTTQNFGSAQLNVSSNQGNQTTHLQLVNHPSVGLLSQEPCQFVLYPNPAKGSLKLKSGSCPALKLEVYDLRGQLVLHIDSNINENMPLLNLKPGMYFAHIIHVQGISIKPFVLQ